MFASITAKLAGLGTVAVLAGAVIASPATALLSPPCYRTGGPKIMIVSNEIDGSCFTGGGTFEVAWGINFGPGLGWEQGPVTATGTFSVPLPYIGYDGLVTLAAMNDATQTMSNIIYLRGPVR